MGRYIIKRVIMAIITVWVLASIVFFLVRLLPGDPFLDDKVPEDIQVLMKKYYGLDKPLHMQYITYLSNLLKGDLGYSLRYSARSINRLIAESFPYSIDLGMRALLTSVIAGLLLGILAALNKDKPWDSLVMIIAIIGVSVPAFVMASVLQYYFSVKLGWFPVAQYKSIMHTILPTIALSFGTLATVARIMRTSMLDIIGTDYIKSARAKGLSEVQVTVKHQIRNSMLPIVTVIGMNVAGLLTGTFVIENIFAIPGLGRYYVLGIQNLDYPMISGLTLVYGTFLVATQLVVDIVYGIVDPRIRVSGKKGD